MIEYEAGVDWNDRVQVAADQHAHHTGWCWDAAGEAYVLTLHREDGSVLGAATYTFKDWMDTFARLTAAHAASKDRGGVYRNKRFSERECDRCGKSYRGPAVYCSFECAEADA